MPLSLDTMAECGSFISTISGETLEKAQRELGEIPEKRGEFIKQLREKIEEFEASSPPDFEEVELVRRDDRFLLMFLRARKFDLPRALQLYLNYYMYRHKYAHMLQNFNPKAVEHILRSGVFGVLEQRLHNGSKVVCIVYWSNGSTMAPRYCV